ncbi:MAG: hypothetical protein J3K34DRAFT_398920 [Monoraphidium minutum]|nr:MAG: hypothetical protein J3K34DRAFT_398920 [Monoraphidium minutum]
MLFIPQSLPFAYAHPKEGALTSSPGPSSPRLAIQGPRARPRPLSPAPGAVCQFGPLRGTPRVPGHSCRRPPVCKPRLARAVGAAPSPRPAPFASARVHSSAGPRSTPKPQASWPASAPHFCRRGRGHARGMLATSFYRLLSAAQARRRPPKRAG